jgi:hypothetical protein
VYVVVFYAWNSWKSFRSLQAKAFTTLAAAEEFRDEHEHAEDDDWYLEIFELVPDEKEEKSAEDDDGD